MEAWDQSKIHSLGLFNIQSILINALHLRSLQALLEISSIIGQDQSKIDQQITAIQNAFKTILWNDDRRCYQDVDLNTGAMINSENISQFLPLFAGIPNQDQADSLISKLCSPSFWPEPGWGICSQSMSSPEFEAQRYWRGPVWINMNWMIIKGLELYNRHDLAQSLAHKTLELVERHGFYEYFNPKTGRGLGSDSFSWTAALVIDLIAAGYE
jgi:neutral trehalase